MLVLSRMNQEEVAICDPRDSTKVFGVIRVADIRGDKVRLGFDFPESVKIYRREVMDAKAKAAEAAEVAEVVT